MNYNVQEFMNASLSEVKKLHKKKLILRKQKSLSPKFDLDAINEIKRNTVAFLDKQLKPYYEDMSFDFSGHLVSGLTVGNVLELSNLNYFQFTFYHRILGEVASSLLSYVQSIGKPEEFNIYEIIQAGIDGRIELTHRHLIQFAGVSRNCETCGETFAVYLDLISLKFITYDYVLENDNIKKCEFIKDNFSFRLKTPSKKLVFTNYFRGILDDDKYNPGIFITYSAGQEEETLNYAKDNIGFIHVGDANPTIYTRGDSTQLLAGMI